MEMASIEKIKNIYIPKNIKQKVYCFVSHHIRRLSLNIAEVIIRLIILYVNQFDMFTYDYGLGPLSFFGYVIHNNFQTIMRNDSVQNSFREVYGKKMIELENVNTKVIHIWNVQVNNIPIHSHNQQIMIGICDVDDVTYKMNQYYGIDNRFNHVCDDNNNIIARYVNIDGFQGKCMMTFDIITVKITKCHNIIDLHFYINDVHCITFYNIKGLIYRLFISTNTLFTSCTLKDYECKMLTK